MDSRSRSGRQALMLARIASFVALGVATGLAFVGLPNVELVTAVSFAAGFLLGPTSGLMTGALTEAIFAGFNPLGSSFGPLLVAQMIGMSLAGLFGGLAAILVGRQSGWRFATVVVTSGAISTLIFDFITNLVFPVMAGFSFSQFVITMVAGIPFAVIHLVSNSVIFAVVLVPLLPRLRKTLRPA